MFKAGGEGSRNREPNRESSHDQESAAASHEFANSLRKIEVEREKLGPLAN